MEGKEFFELAQKLVQMRSEPALRSAISRAYYRHIIAALDSFVSLGFSLAKNRRPMKRFQLI